METIPKIGILVGIAVAIIVLPFWITVTVANNEYIFAKVFFDEDIHLTKMQGSPEETTARMIIRDFNLEKNKRRMNYINTLKNAYEIRFPGLKIEIKFTHQYQNMLKFIEKKPSIIDLAKQAIEKAGLEPIIHPIRGGTDGSRLSAEGILTPNIFAGGLLFHSRKEHIPTIALQKAAEVLIQLADLWTKEK